MQEISQYKQKKWDAQLHTADLQNVFICGWKAIIVL